MYQPTSHRILPLSIGKEAAFASALLKRPSPTYLAEWPVIQPPNLQDLGRS